MPVKSSKSPEQIKAEIDEAIHRSEVLRRYSPTRPQGALDVTSEVLAESSQGPGEHVLRVAKAKPARDLTPTTFQALIDWLRRDDKTIGFISKPLAYSRALPSSKSEHSNIIRVIRGRHLRVYRVNGSPPIGSRAHRDSPYGDRYYIIE
jgi:hypothetical protein